MASKHERHARSRWQWGTQPARSTELAAAVTEPDNQPPGRKDTRAWCKGKPGRPHQRIIAEEGGQWACRWIVNWDPAARRHDGAVWTCHHREECKACGKILRNGWDLTSDECEHHPGDPAQLAEAVAEAERRNSFPRRLRQRIINGPQGYRRPKAGK